ncbi:patatin-like phospholipase family protein [Rhizobium sp. FY34]|uniref:patatin-like phospholipase family protein n=1 Tax=Rhizobium sp. FY34 TaxID=2562309 RepID=UPI001FF01A80|nr:patatin-like phospholipase family protein [Rhizobium sp. FY34]
MTSLNIRSRLPARSETGLFGPEFLEAYGSSGWTEDASNKAAAHQFRTELVSRIATARLSYGRGVEKRALQSIVELFKRAREITAENVGCGTFEILVWHTLNSSVRPFTAKWHPLSVSGALDALDSSDDFRAELYRVQGVLRELERGLALLEGGSTSYNPGLSIGRRTLEEGLPDAKWRPAGGIQPFAELEQQAVGDRRSTYKIDRDDWAAGLALSGGGIRSATFSLGVLAALARRNLLPEFDYLSTVSGGGYAGCFLTSLIGRADTTEDIGLRFDQEPFKRTEQESKFLMGVRQRASFLSGGSLERLLLVMRSTYGIFVNVLVLIAAIAFFSAMERAVRVALEHINVSTWLGWVFPIAALIILSAVSRTQTLQLKDVTRWHLLLGAMFCLPLMWIVLGAFHNGIAWLTKNFVSTLGMDDLSATLLVGGVAIAILGAVFATYANARSVSMTILTVLLLLLVEHAFYTIFGQQPPLYTLFALGFMAALGVFLWCAVDVNETSLHRYYRAKLATAFIHANAGETPPRLSDFEAKFSFFPIVNCALNAPGSEEPKMRGRLSDVFAFTPIMTGSNLIDYHDTKVWEQRNPTLDLAAAMALSGAAVSPQMGLRTTRRASFWLTLINARLNAWLEKPDGDENERAEERRSWWHRGPGLRYLIHEYMASADEHLPYVNISDGGHIENLGVYELLRRRCRYIVAIDGEADPRMTFHALTNLQRLAYIDMGIHIDAELDELRVLESGFSRSHFRFCKVRYPTGNETQPWEIGYLLYVKLSLTGNESEFLRRYRLDEPTFPHHSTADQFFTETQFEAYRSLGEHIGDKLFMEAIIEELAANPSVGVKEWMEKYAKNFMDQK